MPRVHGYGVCAKCHQPIEMLKGETEYVHRTPDISHEPTLKTWLNDWEDQ